MSEQIVACKYRGVLVCSACVTEEETNMTGVFFSAENAPKRDCERCGKPLVKPSQEGSGEA